MNENPIDTYKTWLLIKKDQLIDGMLTDDVKRLDIGWAPYNPCFTLRVIREMLSIQKEYFQKFSTAISGQSIEENISIAEEINQCIQLYDDYKSLWDSGKTDEASKKLNEFFDYYRDHLFNWFD